MNICPAQVTSGMVIGTFLSAPIMYVSAWLLTIPWMDSDPLASALQHVSFNISIISLFALVSVEGFHFSFLQSSNFVWFCFLLKTWTVTVCWFCCRPHAGGESTCLCCFYSHAGDCYEMKVNPCYYQYCQRCHGNQELNGF